MNVTVPALFICDTTNVREGMLSALGMGVTHLWRDVYPAPLLADVGLLVQMHDLARTDEIDIIVRITHEDGDSSGVKDMTMNFSPSEDQPQADPPATFTMPVQLDAKELTIDRPGTHTLRVEWNGALLNSFTFTANLNPPN